MYHNLGYGICTVISELKPVPIVELFSTSLSISQDFLSQGSPARIIKLREKWTKIYFLSMRRHPTFPPEKEPNWIFQTIYLHRDNSMSSFIEIPRCLSQAVTWYFSRSVVQVTISIICIHLRERFLVQFCTLVDSLSLENAPVNNVSVRYIFMCQGSIIERENARPNRTCKVNFCRFLLEKEQEILCHLSNSQLQYFKERLAWHKTS